MVSSLEEVVGEVEALLSRRRLLSVLRGFEEKYGLSSREFVEAWRRGAIPEPEDADMFSDFLSWEAAYEALRRIDKKLRRALGASS